MRVRGWGFGSDEDMTIAFWWFAMRVWGWGCGGDEDMTIAFRWMTAMLVCRRRFRAVRGAGFCALRVGVRVRV